MSASLPFVVARSTLAVSVMVAPLAVGARIGVAVGLPARRTSTYAAPPALAIVPSKQIVVGEHAHEQGCRSTVTPASRSRPGEDDCRGHPVGQAFTRHGIVAREAEACLACYCDVLGLEPIGTLDMGGGTSTQQLRCGVCRAGASVEGLRS